MLFEIYFDSEGAEESLGRRLLHGWCKLIVDSSASTWLTILTSPARTGLTILTSPARTALTILLSFTSPTWTLLTFLAIPSWTRLSILRSLWDITFIHVLLSHSVFLIRIKPQIRMVQIIVLIAIPRWLGLDSWPSLSLVRPNRNLRIIRLWCQNSLLTFFFILLLILVAVNVSTSKWIVVS